MSYPTTSRQIFIKTSFSTISCICSIYTSSFWRKTQQVGLRKANSTHGWIPSIPNSWSNCSKTWSQGSTMCKNTSLRKMKKWTSRFMWSPKTYRNQKNKMASTALASATPATSTSTSNSVTRPLSEDTRICSGTSLSSSIEHYIILTPMVSAKISSNQSWINTQISKVKSQATWLTSITELFKSPCLTSRGASSFKFARGKTSTG